MTPQSQDVTGGDASSVDDVRASGILRTPTIAEIYLDRLRGNAEIFQSAGEVMAVVKADGYGHGDARVARELAESGIRWFAVATPAEGMKLRRAGIVGRILVFAAPLPQHLSAYPPSELDVTVSSPDVADAVIAHAAGGDAFRVHVEVDTGMGRIGVTTRDAARIVARLERAPNVEIAGLWTHLATADEQDPAFAYEQLKRFDAVVADVGDAAEHVHAANSAAALRIPESLRYDRLLIRAGIGLYGYTALDGLAERHGLQPVMKLSSRVTHVKRVEAGTTISYGRTWKAERATRIATVGAGYADGYLRRLSNRSRVAIRGSLYPVTGTICMDMFMVDVGPDGEVAVDDEVTLFGPDGPDAFEVAGWGDTIPYEILTSVSARVPRIYV